jgi:Rhodopirellula transposase DDE domain
LRSPSRARRVASGCNGLERGGGCEAETQPGSRRLFVPNSVIHSCQCRACQKGVAHQAEGHHSQMNWLMSRLTTDQRRWYAAIESARLGDVGDRVVSRITGLGEATIKKGRAEVAAHMAGTYQEPPKGRPGRMSTEEKYPDIEAVLTRLLEDETAGDPMSKKKWVRVSSRRLRRLLKPLGYEVNENTICRLLRKMKYSMKVNVRSRASTTHSPKRDAQFQYIASQKAKFLGAGLPVVSVDSKKKELIGDFRAAGTAWVKEAIQVNEHNFANMATCVATPYGVYDLATNKGYVSVGTSGNTPEFAVAAIRLWWEHAGRHVYPDATGLLLLADGGGGNGCTCRAWKQQLQERFSDAFGLEVTVCHYPPGCSKYNPVERRLFSQISMNWAGKPLTSLEVMLGYIRGTTTAPGLTVEAFLLEGEYATGKKVPEAQFRRLAVRAHATCPKLNYTISPRGESADR